MPLVSRAQAAYLKAHHPAVFREFASKTPKGTHLPYKVHHKIFSKTRKPGDLLKAYTKKIDNKMKYEGDTDTHRGIIKINKRLSKQKRGNLLDTEVHEELHAKHPNMSEKAVQKKTKKVIKRMSRKAKHKTYSRYNN